MTLQISGPPLEKISNSFNPKHSEGFRICSQNESLKLTSPSSLAKPLGLKRTAGMNEKVRQRKRFFLLRLVFWNVAYHCQKGYYAEKIDGSESS